jgi:hypothetical protein
LLIREDFEFATLAMLKKLPSEYSAFGYLLAFLQGYAYLILNKKISFLGRTPINRRISYSQSLFQYLVEKGLKK